MVANDWFLQFLADILDTPVERSANVESTVLGVAYLTALAADVLQSSEQISALWKLESRFEPSMKSDRREFLLQGWAPAVSRIRNSG